MLKLVTFFGALTFSSALWAADLGHCGTQVPGVIMSHAGQVLAKEGVTFTNVRFTITQMRQVAGAAGSEVWFVQYELEGTPNILQRFEYLNFDPYCRVQKPTTSAAR